MREKSLEVLMKRWWLFLAVIIFVVGVGIYFLNRPPVLEIMEIPVEEGLEYEVVEVTTESCFIVVKLNEPTEDQLKAIAFEVWKVEKTPNVFLYLSETRLGGRAYAVVKFGPRGFKDITVLGK